MDILSRLDLYDVGRRYMLGRAKRIEPAQVDTEGSDANLFVGSTSFMGHAISRQLVDRVNALLLEGAEKEDLDRYAFDRYQLTRKGAGAAKTSVTIFRTTSTAGGGSIDIGTKLLSLTNIEYQLTGVAAFGATDLTVINVPVRAVVAGKATQVGANQLRRFKSAGALFDPSLQVNNDTAAAGGEDAEQDEDFRERIRDYWRTARRGTLGAIEFGAKTVAGIVSANAREALTGAAQPARVVSLDIADSSGLASAVLGKEVETQLLDYRAAGIAVLTNLSLPQIVDILLKLTFTAGIDTSTLSENVRAALVEYVNSIGVSQTLYRAGLFSVLQRFRKDGLIVDQNTIVEPVGDLVPAPGVTLRTTLANVQIAA
jgi:uncharacterized phage protein gp47/JayE